MAPAMPEMLAIQPMARSQWPGAGVERRQRNWPAVARAADPLNAALARNPVGQCRCRAGGDPRSRHREAVIHRACTNLLPDHGSLLIGTLTTAAPVLFRTGRRAMARPAAATSPAPGQRTAGLTDENHPAGGGRAPWSVLRRLVLTQAWSRQHPPCLSRLLPGSSNPAARGHWCGTALAPPAAGRHPAHVFGGGTRGHGGVGTTRGSSRPKAPKRSVPTCDLQPETPCQCPGDQPPH